MKSRQDARNRSDYVVVDLPLRLRPDEIERLDAAAARAPLVRTEPAGSHNDAEIEHAREYATDLIRIRREREHVFGTLMFSDPSWDLLLTLFVHRVDGQPISVSSACNNVGVPSSTAFRHLSMLIEHGWVTRHSSESDQGVIYVELERDALERMVTLLG